MMTTGSVGKRDQRKLVEVDMGDVSRIVLVDFGIGTGFGIECAIAVGIEIETGSLYLGWYRD
jgi:hypothetical protein